ncbi:MAG: DUF2127 domain-containing protein [Bryobacteraceae bacterium]
MLFLIAGEVHDSVQRLSFKYMSHATADLGTRAKNESSIGILLIGVFKFIKGLLLISVGIGALKLLHKNVAEIVLHWIEVLRVDPDSRFFHGTISKLLSVTPKQLEAVSAGTFFYAALLLTEGTGLLMRRHWAEYFTVITTAALIPLEIYEIVRRLSFPKITVLVINIGIVVYLIARLRRRRAAPERSQVPAQPSFQ